MRSGAEGGRCPHCKAEVPPDHGPVCVECGGSLQKRYLSIGCLTSKPVVIFALLVPWWGAKACATRPAAERAASGAAAVEDAREDAPGADERADEPPRAPRDA